jgi:hypothetical protein
MTFLYYINILAKNRNHFKIIFIKSYYTDIYINKTCEIRVHAVRIFFR